MSDKVNNSVSRKDTNITQAVDWATGLLNFTLGKSEPQQRWQAIQQWLGGQNQMAAASGVSKSTLKTWAQGREPRGENLEAFLEGTGLSRSFVVAGLIECLQDLAVEEVRFNLARSAFPVPSGTPEKREARRRVLQTAQDEIVAMRQELTHGTGFAVADPGGALVEDEFDGMVLVPRLSVPHGRGTWAGDDTAPIGFRADELSRLGVDIDQCRLVTSPGDEMAPTITSGASVLLDVSPAGQRLQSGRIYAFVIDGNLVLRRYRPMLGGDIELVSDNAKYAPERLPSGFDLTPHVAGRAVWTASAL